MSDKPETFADICARIRTIDESMMRDLDFMAVFLEFLPRDIEAAAERERAIADAMLAVKGKPLPHPDPENAPRLFFPMTKTQLQTLSDLVAIAHDEMDGLPHHEQELERFDALLADMKARFSADKRDKQSAPGNAAAMRAALNQLRDWALLDINENAIRSDEPNYKKLVDGIVEITNNALSAPARNCDRPECADVESAWATYCAETNRADCKGFARWLFAQAEGGDHA